jgi:hypothetical protein
MKRQLEWLIVAGVLVLAGAAAALVGERMVLSQGSVSCTSYVGLWYVTIEGPSADRACAQIALGHGSGGGSGNGYVMAPGTIVAAETSCRYQLGGLTYTVRKAGSWTAYTVNPGDPPEPCAALQALARDEVPSAPAAATQPH